MKRNWEINKINPKADILLSDAAKKTGISYRTLTSWRKTGRLFTYGNPHLTNGEWLIEAIRCQEPVVRGDEPLSISCIRRRHQMRYPLKQKARSAITLAIANGDMIRQSCEVCGDTKKIEAHHPDYSKPLEVKWLCRKHHLLEHIPEERQLQIQQAIEWRKKGKIYKWIGAKLGVSPTSVWQWLNQRR